MEHYWKKKNVLILGGAGFLGSALARALVSRGARVTIGDAMLPLFGGNMFNLRGVRDDVVFLRGDIRNTAFTDEIVQDKDIIFDFAAQVSFKHSNTNPTEDAHINCIGHLHVLDSVRKYAPDARVLFSSSRLVYGKILKNPVSEDHPTNPDSMYGIHKLAGEKYFRFFAIHHGVHTVSARLPNPYGPRQLMKHHHYSLVGWFIRQALFGNPIAVFGDGEQLRDYIYVDDIVDAFLRLAEKGEKGGVYNIGSPEKTRLIDMVDSILENVPGAKKEYVPWPGEYARNESGNYMADTGKLLNDTGWKPKILLSDGIRETVEYYKMYKEHYL